MISPVIVTRGDHPLGKILTQFQAPCFRPIVTVWDNSKQINLSVFGRYVGAMAATDEWVYTQDDDVLTYPEAVVVACLGVVQALRNDTRFDTIVCNMPPEYQANYQGKPERLVGFGCVFHRDLAASTFNRYFAHFPIDALFLRECDRIFTGLNQDRVVVVDVGIEHLPWARDEGRLYRQAEHAQSVAEACRRIQYVLDKERGI